MQSTDRIILYDEWGKNKREQKLKKPVYAYALTYAYGDCFCQDNLMLTRVIPGQKRKLQIATISGDFLAEVEVPEAFGSGLVLGMTDDSIFLEAAAPPAPEGVHTVMYQEIYQLRFRGERGGGAPEWKPLFRYQVPSLQG